ncbi:hypothetical protein AAZX31_08G193600 [Glycine max]|uniref:F-box domain-containing protein n=3 Tax=Glycine subgen. Soja TaxID=1462606 RepID=I1KUW9_SOYBN|nr:FBD-associated F-box protein At5g60610 [Glycine max]XP_028247276.1 FBD-associated F-box protein At5g60610-like [Glycine soja]KAG4399247.1 hypothetical protein GLYMA_08G195400v4 [Glycine max]KAG5016172.1 hypothetical protein JHK85_022308 [Glycine max]KAG5025949.1 hypothetical protein JHK86_021863 [Glycine max]KAG5137113.1 hypothetical protein JHK82_021844 [Glycine max]KAH1052075.1 hypothetical protein GYH30_021772 [Glycine max]|eukprot:XP_006585533.1 FBD-associated F-box protein At5g60610 [Glycine max]
MLVVKKMEEGQIENLPDIVLHDILSRLPEKDAARTSVLSKKWAEIWSTFPILSFTDTEIIEKFPHSRKDDLVGGKKKFINRVNETFLRFRNKGLVIKEFKLSINCFDLEDLSKDIDHWMKLASESGVGVLELCLHDEFEDDQCYILPTGIIEAESLYKLVLMGRIGVDQAFLNHSVKFLSLRVLSLWFIFSRDEQVIEHLISCCPLIEDITLHVCYAMNHGGLDGPLKYDTSWKQSISMLGLPKLKKVEVLGIQKVVIDAPSLEDFHFSPGAVDEPFEMSFGKCRNLRRLYLSSLDSLIITDNWFLDLFPKFPFLDSLKFSFCKMSETINISSAQLKVLELSNCSNLKEVNIDAPNLLSCEYSGGGASKPIISFLNSSSNLEVKAFIEIDFMEVGNLREIIQNFKPQNILASLSLFIQPPIVDELNLDILPVSSTPPSIKHLYLWVVLENETLFMHLVNSLLSCCCPVTISLCGYTLSFSRAFIEFFYETLMGRKEEECFCGYGHTKCWWHGLKDVKVSSSRKSEESIDFKTLFDALPTFLPGENIIFRLEW